MKQWLGAKPSWGSYAAGFAAGLLTLLTWVLTTVVGLTLFNLVFTTVGQLAQARLDGVDPFAAIDRSVLVAMFTAALANLGNVLWAARWGLLVAGGLGLIAAWGEQIGSRLGAQWAARGSFVALALAMTMATIIWVFAQSAQIAERLAQSPELYYAREMFASSFGVDFAVALLLGLLLAAAGWFFWHNWYGALVRRLVPQAAPPATGATAAAHDYQRASARLHALKRGATLDDMALEDAGHAPQPLVTGRTLALMTVLLLAMALASAWVIPAAYRQAAVRMEHSSFYLRAENRPEARVPLQIKRDVRGLVVANLHGLGRVRFTLRGGPDCGTVAAAPAPWEFARHEGEYLRTAIALDDLPPGAYCLDFRQEEGWGMYETSLSHGGGQISRQLALATGVLAALTLGVAVAYVGLILLRLGVIVPAPAAK